ncbi:3-phenylpropionate-dihydrodiol/cinnamic acid-dihydrodiol dehydrogenase [Pseudomonas fluorescens]|uniref:NADP-dependent 3-hydroxy acid dehydrogenase YdfG n=1 Tax=Pseudomonas fluorescens TaxID=294 RepID=A0A8H2NX96_PSEFL|nr:SDR family oxidoreductase [Pseudomonas fluorescens]VVO43714.1 3-phenylpropionate-dihydrodiol/cinnamic acid-dihydrodiol dehydrogenase [Pseudomonas fluorescens]VVP52246.1 3-phenylpropionate-dihydrodiol/cinnamic acid-dihydrodiol dehydrogenase [Pseudomonas fluorescens]
MALSSKGTALITGASSGIGAVYADRLARQGYDLILVARSQGKLNALASHLSDETGRTVEVVAADLTNKADSLRVEQILRSDASITLLVNNAGVGGVMPLLASPVDDMEAMIDLNVTALMRLAYAVVPGFVARGTGTVINIASIVAIAPEILNGVYGGTKAFVLSLSQSMQHELADKGIRIQAVLPGATATDFWSEAGNPVENLPKEIVMSAEDMVDAALAGLAAGEVVTIPGLHDGSQWDRYEAQRKTLSGLFGNCVAAPRYR